MNLKKPTLPQMLYLGVDPGKSGSAVLINGAYQVLSQIRFDETERDISDWFRVEPYQMAHPLTELPMCCGIIERVHAMPKQGVASSFKFGMSYGFLRGMLIAHGIRFETISPAAWQKAMECRTKGDKNITKAKASELFPGVKVIHANADALLLAALAVRRESKAFGRLGEGRQDG